MEMNRIQLSFILQRSYTDFISYGTLGTTHVFQVKPFQQIIEVNFFFFLNTNFKEMYRFIFLYLNMNILHLMLLLVHR